MVPTLPGRIQSRIFLLATVGTTTSGWDLVLPLALYLLTFILCFEGRRGRGCGRTHRKRAFSKGVV